MSQPVTTDEMRRLLLTYEHAIDFAESLPLVVRIPSRPRRWTLLEPLRRAPHLTAGTSTMVLYHVHRSTALLARRYARMAATRGLADEERRAAELVNNFRDSLPAIRWRFIVPSVVLALLFAIRILLREIPSDLSPLALGLSHALNLTDDQRHQLSDNVDHLASAMTFDSSSITGILDEIDKADGAELVVLTVLLFGGAYVIFRPLSSAFRVKRLVFNLATSPAVRVQCTTTTWNSARSTGLYELERSVFVRLGGRPSNEIDLDLWISAAGAAFLTWIVLSYCVDDLKNYPSDRGFGVAFLVIVVGLATCRGAWLLRTAEVRRGRVQPSDLPAGFMVPCGSRLVEVRSLLETASLAGTFAVFQLLYLPSPVWVRLVRERRDLVWAQKQSLGQSPRQPHFGGLWPALGSAILLIVVPPLPVALHLRQLRRLRARGAHSAGLRAWWIVPVIAVTTGFSWFDIYFIEYPALETTVSWTGISILPFAAVFSMTLGVIQWQQNQVIRAVGVPCPHDIPKPGERQESGEPVSGPIPRRRLSRSPLMDHAAEDNQIVLHLPPDARRQLF